MVPIALVFVLSTALTLLCSTVPWLARLLPTWALIIGLVVGVTLSLVDAVLALPFSPWTNLVVLVVAWSGGVLLGRSVAARFRPFLLWFLCFSVVDALLALGNYPQTPHSAGGSSPLLYADFILVLSGGRFAINVVDVLLLTALAEHWHQRGASYLIALLPGVLGFLLADGLIAVTKLGILPGIPFFTVGYVLTEGIYRYMSRRAAPPAKLAR
ncbi:MAG: hypothetical protein C5B60_09385 [Chloroflexi bacterium]|nr:MAG: hypothetical protein C5B60_09385 [Chloroflexota bacterium]